MHIIQKLSLIGAILQLQPELSSGSDPCRQSEGHLHRIGNTRFYFVHNIESRENDSQAVGWKNAAGVCEKFNLKLAKVTKMTMMAAMGRPMEDIVHKHDMRDTWYWMDAKYDKSKENYIWGDGNPVQFHNILYRQPRPVGVGAGIYLPSGNYDLNSTSHQCLAFALPWPGGGAYGHATTFEESHCRQRRQTLCESPDENCRTSTYIKDPFQLTEDSDTYFEDGNWIIGDRKYIINWRQQTFDESKKYCEDMGLQVYTPQSVHDACLVPYLKMWSRNLTVSQFWISWKYIAKAQQFQTENGTVVVNTGKLTVDERSSKWDDTFCAAAALYYEMKDQMPCAADASTCKWNFVEFVPANCKINLGTICQHRDYTNRACKFEKRYISNLDSALAETATVPFAFTNNTQVHRSRYKQTFGSLVCPDGFKMARHNTTIFFKNPSGGSDDFAYDYGETYWVVDDDGFNKTADSKCTVSKPKSRSKDLQRELATVPCTEWHFYLCKRSDKKLTDYKGPAVQPAPTMKWDKSRQPRLYPIFMPS